MNSASSRRRVPVHALIDLTRRAGDRACAEHLAVRLRDRQSELDFAQVRIATDDESAWLAGPDSSAVWIAYRDQSATQVAELAFASAARESADLLVVDGEQLPDGVSLGALRRCLGSDPHIGFAVPRTAGFGRRLVHKIDPELGDPDVDLIPRDVIDMQPPHTLVRDHAGPCVLVRDTVVREFGHLDASFETLAGGLRELMARCRRVGFRTAVVNRAFVEDTEEPGVRTGADAEARDLGRIYALYPEQPRVDENQRRLPVHEYESLLGRAASPSPSLRKTLLIDASDLGATHNGTTESMLGILGGLHTDTRGWRISLLVPPDGAAFHDLARQCPDFERVWPAPRNRFTAAFRLAQPWSVHDPIRLHRFALFNFFFMLDTILDDIQDGAPPGLEQAWAFAARNADGLVYISRYTRDRMRGRFEIAPSVEERVSHLSMSPEDYCATQWGVGDEPYVYVVGNHYPHKWMNATVLDLARAFPFLTLKTLGYENPAIPQLEGFTSGKVPQERVDRLYGEARAIVFPSLYEGFGFPVIKGLAHGRTVIARRSELLDELAAHYRGPGRLVSFSSTPELVEKLGQVLHDLPVETIPLGGALAPDESPVAWPDVAGRILDFIIDRVEKPSSSNWMRREVAIAAMEAFANPG